jgi:hypothetical protein
MTAGDRQGDAEHGRRSWASGPSRINDRAFTASVLDATIAADSRTPTPNLLARASLALATVEAMHPDAPEWPEWRAADRAWVTLDATLVGPVPWGILRTLRGNLQSALRDLRGRLDLADHVELLAEEALTGGS